MSVYIFFKYCIYCDVCFLLDKILYKKGLFFMIFCGGWKGYFGFYYFYIFFNGCLLFVGGIWMLDKNQIVFICYWILIEEGCVRFRQVIGEKEFVKWFGEVKEKKGERRNVFGYDDVLKVVLKGVDKEYRDIDLLKLRFVVVVYQQVVL